MSELARDVLIIQPEMIRWTNVDEGAEVAVLAGNPDMPGEHYTLRFRTSRESKVAAHWHPEDEHVTVLEGPFLLGFGGVFEPSLLKSIPPGSYVYVPRKTRHFAMYGAGTIVQVNGVGPFETIYVNARLGEG
ncbi:MAG TPA: cupin domain-containing protein [Bryobacteraceae bacterium]|jgi:hypothetical protein|nr:cupin domain-containing protein [Bryobacteraceae bacterium]